MDSAVWFSPSENKIKVTERIELTKQQIGLYILAHGLTGFIFIGWL